MEIKEIGRKIFFLVVVKITISFKTIIWQLGQTVVHNKIYLGWINAVISS